MQSAINYINPSDFALIIQSIPDLKLRRFKVESVQMLFKITYYCALRIHEAIRLKKSDFDLEIEEVYLGKTKTKKGDRASIPESFIQELGIYLRSVQTEELFPKMNRQIVHVWTKRLGVMLNIKAWTTPQEESGEKTKTHIFRKTYGKDLLYGTYNDQPAPLNVIQKKLRHADLKTTSGYLAVDLNEVHAWERIKPSQPKIINP